MSNSSDSNSDTLMTFSFSKSNTNRELSAQTQKSIYYGTPFWEWKCCSSHRKGAVGEKLITEIYLANSHKVEKPLSSEYDRLIDNRRAEIKTSFIWENCSTKSRRNSFCFQQLRPAELFDVFVLVAVYPTHVNIYEIEKSALFAYTEVVPQHNGKKGTETYWCFTKDPSEIPGATLVGRCSA